MSRGSQKYGLQVDNSMGSSLLTYRPMISVWQMRMGEAHLASKDIHLTNMHWRVEHDFSSVKHRCC